METWPKEAYEQLQVQEDRLSAYEDRIAALEEALRRAVPMVDRGCEDWHSTVRVLLDNREG